MLTALFCFKPVLHHHCKWFYIMYYFSFNWKHCATVWFCGVVNPTISTCCTPGGSAIITLFLLILYKHIPFFRLFVFLYDRDAIDLTFDPLFLEPDYTSLIYIKFFGYGVICLTVIQKPKSLHE